MSLGRLRFFFVLSILSAGCANAEDITFDAGGSLPDTGSPEKDSGSVDEDTGSPIVDSGSKKDTSVGPEDTGSPVDSGTTSDTGTPVDSSVVDSAVVDSATVDSSADVDLTDVSDTATTDTAVGETGTVATRLATGTLTILGITSDGYVVYTSGSDVNAVSLGGGAPIAIVTSASRVRVSNKAVFTWGTVDTAGFAPLSVWTAANGTKSIATKSLAPSSTAAYALYVAAASADGNWAMFTDGGTTGTSRKADVKVVNTDGTGGKTALTQYVVYDGSPGGLTDYCAPYIGWVGTRFVTSHCTPSGTTVSFDASSVDPSVGTATSLGTDLGAYWTADDAGSKVALVTSLGSLRLVPVAGGTALTIESSVSTAQFTHDGTYVLYRTSGNALKRSPTSTASPQTLISSGVATLLSGASPNDKFLLYSSSSTAGAYDVRLASTTTPGSGTVLYSTAAGEVYGDAFTADSAYALYYQSVASDVGTLTAAPTAGGSGISLGASTWLDWAVAGSKVIWNDGYSSTAGTATIRVRDLASGTGTTTIAANADRTFVLSPTRDRVVYSIASDGLWVAPIP